MMHPDIMRLLADERLGDAEARRTRRLPAPAGARRPST